MGSFFKYFRTPFIVTIVITIISLAIYFTTRPNLERHDVSDLDKNVYDYAGRMSAKQVKELDEMIKEVEAKYPVDIAFVILDESLAEYYPHAYNKYYVQEFADEFAEENKMGYEGNMGSNLVFVDNLYREESSGRVDSWISTYGYARDRISDTECEDIMDVALEGLTDWSDGDDYFNAYSEIVRLIPKHMNGFLSNFFKPLYSVIIAFVISVCYISANWKSKLGKKTTSGTTYVAGGRPTIRQKSDLFVRKTVSKVKIESSSGGGHGGGGHGGGGHSR